MWKYVLEQRKKSEDSPDLDHKTSEDESGSDSDDDSSDFRVRAFAVKLKSVRKDEEFDINSLEKNAASVGLWIVVRFHIDNFGGPATPTNRTTRETAFIAVGGLWF